MKNRIIGNIRYLLLALLLCGAVMGAALTDAASPNTSPSIYATPQAGDVAATVCPASALAEQWPAEVREPGTTRLQYQTTAKGDAIYVSSTICRDPGIDVDNANYAPGTIVVVESGELIVTITDGFARVNIENTITLATVGDTFTLLPGDALILDSGVQASFPATKERVILNVLSISYASVPTGCTRACWLP